jgi:murein DD-endopeptidase MepM/ murein hydrolase activator NlpD
MASYTVLIIPDHASRVRRFRVSRRARWAALAGAVAFAATAAGSVGWLRVRMQMPELDELRADNAQKAEELERLAGSVEQLAGELARVQELERKVRVIANLPAPAERKVGPPGVGGGDADEDLPQLAPAEAGAAGGEGGDDEPAPEGAPDDPGDAAAGSGAPHAARVATLHARAAQLQTQADARARSLARLVDELAGKSRRLASTPSIWPTRGWVTSGYGWRTSPFTGLRQFHAGLDISSKHGTPIVAPARGRVVSAAKDGALGLTLVIDHGYGIRTTYGHTSALFVKKGEEVARGQKIAAVGSTGRSTGPHLHYVVKVDGRQVNPANYVLEE